MQCTWEWLQIINGSMQMQPNLLQSKKTPHQNVWLHKVIMITDSLHCTQFSELWPLLLNSWKYTFQAFQLYFNYTIINSSNAASFPFHLYHELDCEKFFKERYITWKMFAAWYTIFCVSSSVSEAHYVFNRLNQQFKSQNIMLQTTP